MHREGVLREREAVSGSESSNPLGNGVCGKMTAAMEGHSLHFLTPNDVKQVPPGVGREENLFVLISFVSVLGSETKLEMRSGLSPVYDRLETVAVQRPKVGEESLGTRAGGSQGPHFLGARNS